MDNLKPDWADRESLQGRHLYSVQLEFADVPPGVGERSLVISAQSVILVAARSEKEARRKATNAAKKREYTQDHPEESGWSFRFLGMHECYEVTDDFFQDSEVLFVVEMRRFGKALKKANPQRRDFPKWLMKKLYPTMRHHGRKTCPIYLRLLRHLRTAPSVPPHLPT